MMPRWRATEGKKREEHEVEFSRIVAFSDGVFSIAITLLVLEITKLPAGARRNLAMRSGKSAKRFSPTRSASP